MPAAVFVPAQLNDLAVDVALTAPARGDVLYRGATKWNNLAAGTSGQFLKTNGAGADPAWATVDLTTLVTLAPGSIDRNLVQPTGDTFHALVLKSNSASQSASLFETRNSSNTPQIAFSPAGYPTFDTDLTVTGATPIFVMTGGDPGFGRQTFISWKASGSVDFKDRFGNLWWQYDSTVPIVRYQSTLTVQAGNFSLSTSCATPKVVGNAFSTHQLTLDESGVNLVSQVGVGMAADVGFTIRGAASQTGELLRFEQLSSTSAIRTVCQISPVWVDSTDATRKARTVFYVWDTAAREALRIEASGSAPMMGVLGAAAAARTAAYTVTNPVTRRSFDTTTVTLSQLAEAVGTIIADQQTFGWFG